MSLINEALKKAQRQRNDSGTDSRLPGGGHVAKRGQPKSANALLLIGVGALVLVVLSVGITVYLVNRPTTTPAAATAAVAPAEPAMKAKTEPAAPSPSISLPPITAPAISPTTTASAPVATPPPSAQAPKSTEATTPSVPSPIDRVANMTPAPEVEPAASPSVPVPTAQPDEGIYQYVDALRITGVKAAGNDSRVLMNDRVYRINDIVERVLGIRLIKVEPNTLTFSDANGAHYVKNF